MFWLRRNRRSHMQRRYITVDVFTDRAFGGNPLAVILEAGGPLTPHRQARAAAVSAPQLVSGGLSFLVAEVASRDALRRARPDADAFARTLPCDGSDAVYLYTRDVATAEACDLQARMFHPGSSGLSEDPATGSATAAAAALLADLSGERDGESKLRIGQGVDMNRPSLLLTRVRKANGVVMSAHVGGACVQMMEGTFRLAGEG